MLLLYFDEEAMSYIFSAAQYTYYSLLHKPIQFAELNIKKHEPAFIILSIGYQSEIKGSEVEI